jgi:hypothetical protein
MRSSAPSILLVALCLFSSDITYAQAPSINAFERLRPTDSHLASVVHEATVRSRTFRELVDTLGKTDGIVYVEPGKCRNGVRACLVAVTPAPPYRLVRVRVNTRQADWELMGSIGHELRHALEVLSDPGVTSNSAMYLFYLREGRQLATGFETVAAMLAGDSVRAEARRPNVPVPSSTD